MSKMKKVVVIGGTGLIGSKAVKLLQDAGHEAVVASSATGSMRTRAKGWPRRLGCRRCHRRFKHDVVRQGRDHRLLWNVEPGT